MVLAWWGAKGDATGRELYKLMFEYYVNQKHLDNLLWVWNSPEAEGYPGDEYVDVISRDIYLTEKKAPELLLQFNGVIAFIHLFCFRHGIILFADTEFFGP